MDKTLDLQCKGSEFDSRAHYTFLNLFILLIFFSSLLTIHAAYIYAHRAQRVKHSFRKHPRSHSLDVLAIPLMKVVIDKKQYVYVSVVLGS